MFKELLATAELPELGPGPRRGCLTEAEVRRKLAECFGQNAPEMERQQLITALILLWHDHLDASHTIAQGIASADGAFVHGIMHRREPDYSNAKYWFQRVGNHPAFPEIALRAKPLFEKSHEDLQRQLLRGGEWDSFAFIDACERASQSRDSGEVVLLRKLQGIESEVLLNRFSGVS